MQLKSNWFQEKTLGKLMTSWETSGLTSVGTFEANRKFCRIKSTVSTGKPSSNTFWICDSEISIFGIIVALSISPMRSFIPTLMAVQSGNA